MLVSVLLVVYNLFIAFASGLVLVRLFSKLLNLPVGMSIHPAIVVLLGWSFMSILLQCYHLFFPIQLMAHCYVAAVIALFGSIWCKLLLNDALASLNQIATKKHLIFGFGYLVILLLNICTRNATGDIGDYHLQAIKWIEEYAVVPGVGNVRRQLANNSNWFLLNAFSGLSFLGLRSVYTINACLAFMVALFMLSGLNQKFWLRNLIILLYFIMVATRKYTGAVTNDLAITGGVVLLFCWFVDVIHLQQKQPLQVILMIVVTATLVTYKLSALPLMLFALGLLVYLILHKYMFTRQLIVLGIVGLVLYVPWLITNVINSGYIIFPMVNGNWFGVDWEMRPEIVFFEFYSNLAYARAPLVDIEVARHYTLTQWWPHWITSLDYFSIMLMLTTLVMLLFCVIRLVTNKAFRSFFISNYYHLILLTCTGAFILWFTHAPSPRFIWGYMIFITSTGIHLLSNFLPLKQLFKHHFKFATVLLFGSLLLFFTSFYPSGKLLSVAVLPPPYSQSDLNMVKVQNGCLLVPSANSQCWDAALPCTSLPDTGLVFRGTSLQQGFRIKK